MATLKQSCLLDEADAYHLGSSSPISHKSVRDYFTLRSPEHFRFLIAFRTMHVDGDVWVKRSDCEADTTVTERTRRNDLLCDVGMASWIWNFSQERPLVWMPRVHYLIFFDEPTGISD